VRAARLDPGDHAGGRQDRHHDEEDPERGQDAVGASAVERPDVDPAAPIALAEQQRGDEEPGQDEEHLHAEVAGGEGPAQPDDELGLRQGRGTVAPDDQEHRDRADAVERGERSLAIARDLLSGR
jgi:hypothetical protein